MVLVYIVERAKSPPLSHQDEIELSDDDVGIENGDEAILDEYTATGNYRPGNLLHYVLCQT